MIWLLRPCLVVGIKCEISLHPLRRENFFQKLFGQFHKSLYLCTAVPVVPLPDIQVLVMNPGFFYARLFTGCKDTKDSSYYSPLDRISLEKSPKRPPRWTAYNI